MMSRTWLFLCFIFQSPPVYGSTYLVCVKAAGISAIVCFYNQTSRKMFQYESVLLVILSGLICMIIHLKHILCTCICFGVVLRNVCACPRALTSGFVFFFFFFSECHAVIGREEGGLGGLWSWWLCSFAGRHGFAGATLTAKKQAVPSPATASTEVHRNPRVSSLCFPPRSRPSQNCTKPSRHFREREREGVKIVWGKRERKRWKERWKVERRIGQRERNCVQAKWWGNRVQDRERQNVLLLSPACPSLSLVSSVTNPDLTNSLRLQCKPVFCSTVCLRGQLPTRL